LIGLFELPEDDTIPDDEHFIEIEDTPGKFLVGLICGLGQHTLLGIVVAVLEK
jgi:hypothetical protein